VGCGPRGGTVVMWFAKKGAGARPPGRGSGGRGRPPRRWDSPPRTGGTGRGTNHKGSAQASAPVIGIAFALLAAPGGLILGVVAYLLNGYGVL
jgi:hypothetical protein